MGNSIFTPLFLPEWRNMIREMHYNLKQGILMNKPQNARTYLDIDT
jgi:hypothetical protein